ncbi:hypothetical protein EH165_12825 [Nakamurella antarctica]|uniref:Uncharacterized protein n=1 Tax=Nakamurella antarctica TaxID=1902245 RepID=A0A3G8ZNR7_9ACTN|nr:hypothetical protein [Nakamurella antarctica]AZI58893.1 hypothetical protein EH165_12825 [Nakamurella antarctica]
MTASFQNLDGCEFDLEDDAELLYRQIPTHNWDPNVRRPLSHAFGPSSADKGKPSYARSSLASPSESRAWHNENANSKSEVVFAVSVAEVKALDTRSVDDSQCREGQSPGHCYVDFRHLEKFDERKLRAKLYNHAIDRWKIPSESD